MVCCPLVITETLGQDLFSLLLFLSECAVDGGGAGDPLCLEDMQRGTKSKSC